METLSCLTQDVKELRPSQGAELEHPESSALKKLGYCATTQSDQAESTVGDLSGEPECCFILFLHNPRPLCK